jgi:hypothetical protein
MRVAAAAKSAIWVDRDAILDRYSITDRTLRRWVADGKVCRKGQMYDIGGLMGVSALAMDAPMS